MLLPVSPEGYIWFGGTEGQGPVGHIGSRGTGSSETHRVQRDIHCLGGAGSKLEKLVFEHERD